jgi:hypothetical protein
MMDTPGIPTKTGFAFEVGSNPKVLILGSFPGEQALARQEYYGNPRNHFWQIMEALFSFDRHLPYRERIDLLLSKGIALWDTVRSCRRIGSGDDVSSMQNPPTSEDFSGSTRRSGTSWRMAGRQNGSSAARQHGRRSTRRSQSRSCLRRAWRMLGIRSARNSDNGAVSSNSSTSLRRLQGNET